MWFYAASIATLAVTVGLSAGLYTRRLGLARAVLARAPFDLPRDAAEWLLPNSRLDRIEGCTPGVLGMALVVFSGIRVGHGWQALYLALVVFFSALKLGEVLAKLGGPLTPVLNKYAARAREHAGRVIVAGDTPSRTLARELAAWIEMLARNAPHLTYAGLEEYYTPHQVAGILEDFMSGSDDYELNKWLGQPARALYASSEEDFRVTLLEEVRREVAGHPTPERFRELVTRLRQ